MPINKRTDSIVKLLADNFGTEANIKGFVIADDQCANLLLGCFPSLSLHYLYPPKLRNMQESSLFPINQLIGYSRKEFPRYPNIVDDIYHFYDFAVIGYNDYLGFKKGDLEKLEIWQRINIGGLVITDLGGVNTKVDLTEYNGLRWAKKDNWIICSGCSRSGSMYMSRTMNAIGFKVGHQRYRKDGISSGVMAPCIFPEGTVVLHQIRHPVDNIRSLAPIYMPNIAKYAGRFIPIADSDSPLLIAMKYWYYWNKMAEERGYFIFALEDMADAWDDICNLLGIWQPFPALQTNIHINKRPRPETTWSDIFSEDEQLAVMICDMAKRYRYNIAE